MPRLTVKWLLNEMTATMTHYWNDLIRRERQLKDYCDHLYFRLDFQANVISVESDKISEQGKKIQTLTQLAAQQAETIAMLTGKLEELANAVNELADEEALSHQWLDRQQQRIVALEKRESLTFTLSESNARRGELQGAWIAELFNRLNDHVNNE